MSEFGYEPIRTGADYPEHPGVYLCEPVDYDYDYGSEE